MKKNEVYSVLDEINNQLNQQQEETNRQSAELFKESFQMLDNYISFTKGISDVQKWVEENRIIYGRKFSYYDAKMQMMLGEKDKQLLSAPRPYLIQWMNDPCRDKTMIKCRQSEMTENEINENIFLAVSRPFTNVRHIFPTSGMALQIAREKISPAVENSPNILNQIKRPLNVMSKEFRNGSFYTMDGSWTETGGRGPSSDKITFDEYETQNPQIEDIFSESTSHSELGKKTRISTPKFPNGGIDLMYNKGSKYDWVVTCEHCNKEQVMTFPDNVQGFFDLTNVKLSDPTYLEKLNKVYIGCKFCGKYIDRTSEKYIKKLSRWIPEVYHLIATKASYRVTYFMLPWKTGKEILYKFHTFKYLHQFWNEVIGYAFVAEESVISKDLFLQCQNLYHVNSYHPSKARNISIGVDWGVVSWVVIRGNGFQPDTRKCRILYIERIDVDSLKKHGYEGLQTDHAKRVGEIIDHFKASIVINDANGIGVDRNSYLVRKYPTRVYGCFYDTNEIQKEKAHKERLIVPQWNEGSRIVTVSRVGTFKGLIQDYEEKKTEIPRVDAEVSEFIEHHTNIAIQQYEDVETGALFEVVGKMGADHYCFIGNTIVITNRGEIPIQEIRVGDYVLTRKGFKKVLRAGKTGIKNVNRYIINGLELEGTFDHKVWELKGFKGISLLNNGDICYILSVEDRILCQTLLKLKLFIKELNLEDIRNQKIGRNGFIIRQVLGIGKEVLKDFIKKYGKINMAKFLLDMLFIIRIMIPIIIKYQILNACKKENIKAIIKENIIKNIEKNLLRYLIGLDRYQKGGIKQMKEYNYIKKMQNIYIIKNIKRFVNFVIKNILLIVKKVNFVVKNVWQKKGVNQALIMKKESVGNAVKNLKLINIIRQKDVGVKKEVYNLEVEDEHEYFANGILVSNCHADNYSKIGFDKLVNNESNIVVGIIKKGTEQHKTDRQMAEEIHARIMGQTDDVYKDL